MFSAGKVRALWSWKLSALVLAVMIIASCGLATSAAPSHRRPYQWYPYLTGSGEASDKGSSRRAGVGGRGGETEKRADRKNVVITLPATLLEYCEQYAEEKKMSVDALVRLILTQGIAATADAEDYL